MISSEQTKPGFWQIKLQKQSKRMILKENPTKTKEEFQCDLLAPVTSTCTWAGEGPSICRGPCCTHCYNQHLNSPLNTNQI